MKLIVGIIGWLGVCAVLAWWLLPRLEREDIEADHELAIRIDKAWDRTYGRSA